MSTVAIVFGGSGLVGSLVITELLARPDVSRVVGVSRRSLGRTHAKWHEVLVPDFATLGDAPPIPGVTAAFVCLGTTIKTAGSQARFREVDHDYAVAAARLAGRSGAKRLGLVSAIGASTEASTFYSRVKGETERDVAEAATMDALVVARPSLLLGERTERRTAEHLGIVVARPIAGLFRGPLAPYRPIEADVVARALVQAVLAVDGPLTSGRHVLTYDDMARLAAKA